MPYALVEEKESSFSPSEATNQTAKIRQRPVQVIQYVTIWARFAISVAQAKPLNINRLSVYETIGTCTPDCFRTDVNFTNLLYKKEGPIAHTQHIFVPPINNSPHLVFVLSDHYYICTIHGKTATTSNTLAKRTYTTLCFPLCYPSPQIGRAHV